MIPFEDWVTAALAYAGQGWPVVPLFSINVATGACTCGRKPGVDCSPGKHPRTDHGLSDASTDPAAIEAWGKLWPQSNLAMLTGAASGYIVLDVDPKHGGLESIKAMLGTDVPGPEWGAVAIQRTGSGGYHLLYRHPDKTLKNRVGLRPGLDIRGDGGYIVVAPSNHATDGVYDGVYEWLSV